MSQDLHARLAELACQPVLLVASDYDGTLSPIGQDPAQAVPHREAIVALRSLSALPGTHVAIISGRALRDLARLSGVSESVMLIGSHGTEFDLDYIRQLDPRLVALREDLLQELRTIAATDDGFLLEEKPSSIAIHYRKVERQKAESTLDSIRNGLAARKGVTVREGKMVLELAIVPTNKGQALESLRQRVGATAAIFLGDDVTDEDAFATLHGPDLGVKIGEGESAAPFRLADTEAAAQLLAELCELRTRHFGGAEATPIEQFSLLSDQRALALCDPHGDVVWLAAPRLDAAPLFARLLGDDGNGRFRVRPHGDGEPVQSYLGNSFVLETLWPHLRLRDCLDCSDGRTQRRPGRTDLIRIVERAGSEAVVVELEFAPRVDFGRVPTRLRPIEHGILVEHAQEPIVLVSPGVVWRIEAEGRHDTARASVELGQDPILLELRWGTGSTRASLGDALRRMRQTEEYWSQWVGRLEPPKEHADLALRSAMVIKGLCYGPTGAIAAAATTSLPEHIGGVRNWDYRYCWLRDGAFAAMSLARLGSSAEAMAFLDWVLRVVDQTSSSEWLRPVYDVDGRVLAPEAEIAELSGYRGSRPVRVGNAASVQVQLDVFGSIVELIELLLQHDAPLSAEHWRLVDSMVEAVSRRWMEADHGIWEVRGERRHHVHSKLMCWVAVDRGVRIARAYLGETRTHWETLRDTIREDLLTNGVHPEQGGFTVAYGSPDIDASALLVGLKGLVPPDHPSFVRTVELVEQELLHGPTVYRYHYEDGLPGFEGGFHLCTSWLIEAYWLVGRHEDARALLQAMIRLVGPTGLLPEQYGAHTERALGNHPQVYSHLALIDALLRVSQ